MTRSANPKSAAAISTAVGCKVQVTRARRAGLCCRLSAGSIKILLLSALPRYRNRRTPEMAMLSLILLVTASLCSLHLIYAQPTNNTVSVGGKTPPMHEHCPLRFGRHLSNLASKPKTPRQACLRRCNYLSRSFIGTQPQDPIQ